MTFEHFSLSNITSLLRYIFSKRNLLIISKSSFVLLARNEAESDGRSPRGAYATPAKFAESILSDELKDTKEEVSKEPSAALSLSALPPSFRAYAQKFNQDVTEEKDDGSNDELFNDAIEDFSSEDKKIIDQKNDHETNHFFSPLVLNIAKEENISIQELEKINGSGKENRIKTVISNTPDYRTQNRENRVDAGDPSIDIANSVDGVFNYGVPASTRARLM